MREILERLLETTVLLAVCCDASSTSLMTAANAARTVRHDLLAHFVDKRKIAGDTELISRRDFDDGTKSDHRSYYSVPTAPFIPAFDPISVLASLAFLAFLLQSFAALFDRTRSIIPTIISSRRSSVDYGEHFADIEKRVLRALDEYANVSNDLLDGEKENERSTS